MYDDILQLALYDIFCNIQIINHHTDIIMIFNIYILIIFNKITDETEDLVMDCYVQSDSVTI